MQDTNEEWKGDVYKIIKFYSTQFNILCLGLRGLIPLQKGNEPK